MLSKSNITFPTSNITFPISNCLIIGLSGKLGSGKNFIGEHIIPPLIINKFKSFNVVFHHYSFGDFLKFNYIACNLPVSNSDFDISNPNSDYFQYNVLDLSLPSPIFDSVFVSKTSQSRKDLQKLADEFKTKYSNDVWIKYLASMIRLSLFRSHQSNVINCFIISDVRFVNEYNFITNNNGVVIRIYAPDRNSEKLLSESNGDINIVSSISSHSSEVCLDFLDSNYKYIINNSKSNVDSVITQCQSVIDSIV